MNPHTRPMPVGCRLFPETPMPEHIRCDLEDSILTITLNRPDKLNAYTAQMGREIAEAFDRADQDDAVRVVIVTGAGKAFCAGADISGGATSFGEGASVMFGGGPDAQPAARKTPEPSFIDSIYRCRKPSIAALNGAAVGVGITVTLPMDIRIAASNARVGFVFARRGLVPEAGSAWFLPRLVGLQQALRWCYSGRLLNADEVLRGGLVSEVVPPEELLPRAREIAREIVEETAPVSIALTRQLLWRFSSEPDPLRVREVDVPMSRELGRGPDVTEGVKAFLEKRKPNFPGKVSTDMPSNYPWWNEPDAS
jgi:enoyl-CoA hydratase/carnithine racemase